MKIAIIGTGGVGGYFGGRLAQAGFDVRFLARGEHLKAIQKNGLQVKSINGDFTLKNVQASDQITKLGVVDAIIICLKAWQVKENMDALQAIAHKNTLVLPLQNGVLVPEELHEGMRQGIILGGLCRIFSMIEAPGVIHHKSMEPSIIFGDMFNTQSIGIKNLKDAFDLAHIKSRIAEDIQVDLWNKFISICTSGLLAVSRTTYGECRKLPETRKMMIDLMQEIWNVGKKAGVNLADDFIERTTAFIDTFPPDSTSSLTRDVWAGNPSEIEYQNGTVVQLGKKYGVPTPINSFIYSCIWAMEQKARKK